MLAEAFEVIHSLRPHLRPYPRAIVDAMTLSERSIGSATVVADRLGLRSRFQLARLLKREGLPPLHKLAAWLTVLSWTIRAERTGESLCVIAFRSHRHPSACYRLVRETTGKRWEEVRDRGSLWLQQQMLATLRKSSN